MLITIKHLFTVEIRQIITQQFSVPASIDSLTENWALLFLDFKTNIWCGCWKFSWVFNFIQFLLYCLNDISDISCNAMMLYHMCKPGNAMFPRTSWIQRYFLPVQQFPSTFSYLKEGAQECV